MPELRSFEVLLAIARTGSLSGAGRYLGIAQQSVSARLNSLESLTGTQLVLRKTRGSQLSKTGIVMAEWAEQLIGVAERVDAGIASLREANLARLRIGASFTVAEQLMPRWLVSLPPGSLGNGFSASDVVLAAMNSDKVTRAIYGDEVDLGFVEGPTSPTGLHSRVVANDELVVVVHPSHKWARRSKPLSADELSQTPLVLRESGSGTRESLVTALKRKQGSAAKLSAPLLELSSVTAIRAAVLSGSGPTVLSRLSAADDLQLNRLREVPVADLELTRKIRAVWRGGQMPPAGAIRDLLSHILRQRKANDRLGLVSRPH
jgi:molybdate transport repressor ModE-like protein